MSSLPVKPGTHDSVRPWLARQLQPLVPPQVSHLRQVPLRTRVKLPHSVQLSPSTLSSASERQSGASLPLDTRSNSFGGIDLA
jgi:hypothetical protein